MNLLWILKLLNLLWKSVLSKLDIYQMSNMV